MGLKLVFLPRGEPLKYREREFDAFSSVCSRQLNAVKDSGPVQSVTQKECEAIGRTTLHGKTRPDSP
jgi:hypothetical protein